MFLVFALLLLSLGVWLFLSMYSVFFPFFQQISNITQYNSAYYSALSSVERASLVLKYKTPGFEWSGGFMWSTSWWPISDSQLSFLTGSTQWSSWKISSRTQQIPLSGAWNTDILLQTWDSPAYNVLWYNSMESIPLSYDNTTNGEQYYTWTIPWNIVYFHGNNFTGTIRLPPFVYINFNNIQDSLLCDGSSRTYNCDLDGDAVYDEVKVNRSLVWYYAGIPFKLIPTPDVFYYSGSQVNYPYDSTIRASTINNLVSYTLPLTFWAPPYWFSPLISSSLAQQNSISATGSIKTKTFQELLSDTNNTTWLQFSLWIISLLRSRKWDIYPYLEYNLTFPFPVSSTDYVLDTHGRNRAYDVEIIIKKPTTNKTVGGDFTVIF